MIGARAVRGLAIVAGLAAADPAPAARTAQYFALHTIADVYHSNVWKEQLVKCVEAKPETAERALRAAEDAARALWDALDGIEERRLATAA